VRPDIIEVAAWLEGERAYAEGKWAPGYVDDSITAEEYEGWVMQYLHRAIVLGVENPLGKQALAKALRTCLAFTESVVRRFGPLPDPGVPSGEICTFHRASAPVTLSQEGADG
jgi:hypothetical protein